ncbi:hypothetical protein [Dyadobacter fermentans]|uniref:hypothetical protein n=1 Tax=Dyadobacter fermentans TaxID=94254 RepID=UPI001CBE3295|nr:hypothetical protein [Dyadobacter fermentans]MBZ1357365.1 hypothetical protein [Dyadobacter fermentans]
MASKLSKICRVILPLVLAALCSASTGTVTTDLYVVVRGKFDGQKVDRIFSYSCVKGITYYLGWSRVNPSRDRYDFSDIEKAIANAAQNNKKLNIAILPGRWTPEWVFRSRVKTISWVHQDDYVEDGSKYAAQSPVPWDSLYLTEYFKMLRKLAVVVNKNKHHINSVAITGGSNTNGIETNMIGGDSELRRVGFTGATYTNNWKRLMDEFHTDFPDIMLTLSVHNMYGSKRTDAISKDLINYARDQYKGQIKFAALAFTDERWFNKGNQYADLVLELPKQDIILQSIKIYSKKSDQQGFNKLLNKCATIGPAWLEIWDEDMDHEMIKCK